MSTRKITFDPTSGVPYAANFNIYGGAHLRETFNVVTTSNTAFNLTGYTASAQMSKSVAVGATLGIAASFTAGIHSAADGVIRLDMSAADTRTLKGGRYVYNILVGSGPTIYSIANGNILVNPAISVAP